MRKITSCALVALQLFLAGAANADDDKKCECEQHVKSPKTAQDRDLAANWTPSDPLLRVYKQNYFLFYSHSSQPNSAPTSPNTKDQAPFSYPLDNKEMKFQISIKAHMLGEARHTMWFGYTQLSFWQIYDTEHSGPFRDTNHEPELIYSYRPESLSLGSGISAKFLNSGIVHQSNGQALPRSRSWNRMYVQVGLESDFGDNGKLALLPRAWRRLGGGGTADDDNPDIMHYLGYGDIEARYYYGQGVLSAIAKRRSLQLDLAIPAPSLFGIKVHNTDFHLQVFSGYGESLIDYNQRHSTVGIGMSLPFE